MFSFRWTCTLFPCALLAQRIDYSIGARAGLLLNRPGRDTTSVSNSIGVFRSDAQRFTLGPTFEVGFKKRFGVEFSSTWRREGSTSYSDISPQTLPVLPPGGVALLSQFTRETTPTWDFALVGKYYFGSKEKRIRPFVGFGPAATRRSSTVEAFSRLASGAGQSASTFRFQSARWNAAPVATFGARIRSGRVDIVPEFRFLRDANRGYPRNRAEFFLGFRFW